MTPTPLPGLDLDLDYPAADPAVRLAERAIAAGRRRHRRNRVTAVATVLLVTSTAVGSWWSTAGPAAPVQVAGSSDLPASVGRGPGRQVFVDPSYRGPLGPDSGPAVLQPPYPNRYVDVGPAEGAARAVAFQTRDGYFCFGSQSTRGALPESSACRAIVRLPAEGIWVGTVTITTTLSPEPTVVSDGDPVLHTLDAGSGRLLLMGVVRGPLSRVTVDLEGGRSLPTRLVPAPNPRLGTVFFASVTSDEYDRALTSLPVPTAEPLSVSVVPVGVTVYRGDRAVFRCDAESCPGM